MYVLGVKQMRDLKPEELGHIYGAGSCYSSDNCGGGGSKSRSKSKSKHGHSKSKSRERHSSKSKSKGHGCY
jgi:hypothetical protein